MATCRIDYMIMIVLIESYVTIILLNLIVLLE